MTTLSVKQLIYILSGILLLCLLIILLKQCSALPPSLSVTHTTVTNRTVSLRPDSIVYHLRTPAKAIIITARATKRTGTTAGLDTIGYFSPGDTTQVFPDTASIRYDSTTDLFMIAIKESERRRKELIRFLARDSIITVHDSVREIRTEPLPFWHDPLLFAGGFTVGAVIAVLLTLFLH